MTKDITTKQQLQEISAAIESIQKGIDKLNGNIAEQEGQLAKLRSEYMAQCRNLALGKDVAPEKLQTSMLRIASRIQGLKSLVAEKKSEKDALEAQARPLREAERLRLQQEREAELDSALNTADRELADAQRLLDQKEANRAEAAHALAVFRAKVKAAPERERMRLATGKIA